MGYPDREYEREILTSHRTGEPVDELQGVCGPADLMEMQRQVREVKVEPTIAEYMLNIVQATRDSEQLSVGVSTRGSLLWYRATQASAYIEGRNFVVPDDAKNLAVAVLSHRVQLPGLIQSGHREETESVIREIVSSVASPR